MITFSYNFYVFWNIIIFIFKTNSIELMNCFYLPFCDDDALWKLFYIRKRGRHLFFFSLLYSFKGLYISFSEIQAYIISFIGLLNTCWCTEHEAPYTLMQLKSLVFHFLVRLQLTLGKGCISLEIFCVNLIITYLRTLSS